MNKSVLISNLEVLTKELNKVEREIGKEYALTLEKSRFKEEITKEEFYLENALTITFDIVENIEMLIHLLKHGSPEHIVKIAEEDGRDYKEISMDMKQLIVTRKLEQNPMLGMIATFEALLKMAEEKANK